MEISTERISARSKRQAMDWSLALVSQGIEPIIDHSPENGWALLVATPEHERALQIIHQYRIENLGWPWRQKILQQEVFFDWGCLAWLFLIAMFYWLGENGTDLREIGAMDAIAVSHGEWWRLFTAVYLHADLGHLAANACIGVILLGLAMGRYGTGIGLLAALLTGAGGNVATWLVYPKHQSLGASGLVMGALGLLAAQSVSLWRKNPPARKLLLGGIGGGVMLFVLFGLSPGTDVLAHLGGFVTGLLLGSLLLLKPKLAQNSSANILAGALFCLVTVSTWLLALSGGKF